MSICSCGTGLDLDTCCGPLLSGETHAETAEALMRARYSAFAMRKIDFLSNSLHPDHREDHDAPATRRWAENSEWLGLEIRSTTAGGASDDEGVVEFIATFKEKGVIRRHHEKSQFRKEGDTWYYVDGEMVPPKTEVHQQPKVGRNKPCPCGSGKKYKKCCGG
ncbi:MAG: YchJ family protein [Gammaproteobacteria bacterium]|nr:YchJ family protein [Gammaproteobacteria bacterium]